MVQHWDFKWYDKAHNRTIGYYSVYSLYYFIQKTLLQQINTQILEKI